MVRCVLGRGDYLLYLELNKKVIMNTLTFPEDDEITFGQ